MSVIQQTMEDRIKEIVGNTEDAIVKAKLMDRQIMDNSITNFISIDPKKFIPGRLRSAVSQLTMLLGEIDSIREKGIRDSLRENVAQKIRDYNTKILSYEGNVSSTYHS